MPPIPPNDSAWQRLHLEQAAPAPPGAPAPNPSLAPLFASAERLRKFHQLLADDGLADTYEAAHARLAIQCLAVTHTRLSLLAQEKLRPLTNAVSQAAADRSYLDTARKVIEGLERAMANCQKDPAAHKQRLAALWSASAT